MPESYQGQVQVDDDNHVIETTVAVLMRKRAEFEIEIKMLNAEIEGLDRAIAALDGVIAQSCPIRPARKASQRKGSLSAVLREIAISELKRSGRPLTRSQILEKVSSYGVTIDKADPAKFLSRVLWRSPELVNDGNGYRLVSSTPD